FIGMPKPPTPPRFPYTTLFRSGAGQGIGKATALALAGAGAHVAVVDINGQQAEETGSAVMALGPRGLALEADVGNLQHIDRMVRDRKSTRLNSSHRTISYAVFC